MFDWFTSRSMRNRDEYIEDVGVRVDHLKEIHELQKQLQRYAISKEKRGFLIDIRDIDNIGLFIDLKLLVSQKESAISEEIRESIRRP